MLLTYTSKHPPTHTIYLNQQALGELTRASFSLGVALDTLPPASKMSSADKRLREEIEKLIHQILRDERRPESMLDSVWKGEADFLPNRQSHETIEQPDVNGKRPWDCAYAIVLPILKGESGSRNMSKEEREAEDKIVMESSVCHCSSASHERIHLHAHRRHSHTQRMLNGPRGYTPCRCCRRCHGTMALGKWMQLEGWM